MAGLILRATCEWPQKHGWELLEHFHDVKGKFLAKVGDLTKGLYAKEPEPTFDESPNAKEISRQTQACLISRTLKCPSCEGTIPLSPNWRLNSKGTGMRLIPDISFGTCSFEIVTKISDQSPGTVFPGQGHLPLPQLRGNNPRRLHLHRGAGWTAGTPDILHHLQGYLVPHD